MSILFLDDDPARHHRMTVAHLDDVVHCYTIDQFIDTLRRCNTPFDIISLDHDLNDFDCSSFYNGREATGLDACWLMIHDDGIRSKLPATIHIHSVNPRGARAMADFLTARGFGVKLVPFNESGLAPAKRKASRL